VRYKTTNTLTDISDNGNTHTATTKNITRISYLKNLVDIDGKDSDVDLTHWDVSQLPMSWLKACAL
jgi:hypothetical protein